MKAKLFFLLIAGFALSMLSCNSDPPGTSNDDNTAGTYGTTGSTHDPRLAFSVDDIKSYNITTREIVLTDVFSKKLTTPNDEVRCNRLILYYNDEPLFEEVIISYPVDSNPWRDYIVLSVCGYNCDYPFFFYKNTQEYQTEWDTFIKYLTDAGKIVE